MATVINEVFGMLFGQRMDYKRFSGGMKKYRREVRKSLARKKWDSERTAAA